MKITKTYSIDEKIYQEFDELSKKFNINKSSFFEEKILDFIRENEETTSIFHGISCNKNLYHTPDRRLKKWSPISDALKVTDKKIKQIICDYAEYHQFQINLNEFKEKMGFIKKLDSYEMQDLVPSSCKILSQLNLKDKNIILKEDISPTEFNIPLTNKEYNFLKNKKITEEFYFVNNLMKKIVDYINKELETKNNLYITILVDSLTIESTKFILTSRIHIE